MILFVRHSIPALTSQPPASSWPLSHEGRARAVGLGRQLAHRQPPKVVASSEVKAVETAELLSLGPVDTDERLREVTKPWYATADGHRDAACEYLLGAELDDWEPQDRAVSRFGAAIDELADGSVVVSHGTVWTLWLSRRIPALDAVGFWNELRMPDAHVFDRSTGELRSVGT